MELSLDELSLDENGFVWLGDFKICRLTPWGLVEFYDRDKKRASKRGSHYVYTTPSVLYQLISIIEVQSNDNQDSGDEDTQSIETSSNHLNPSN